MRRSRIGWLSLWLLGLFLSAGCQRKESVATDASSSETAAQMASTNQRMTTPAAASLPTNFSVPFRGTIKAKEQRDLLLNSSEITYTFGDRKVRREAVRTAPGGKLADLGLGSAGIICDLQTERVTLYRTGPAKKACVRMSLSEYQKLATNAGALPAMGIGALSTLTARPSLWRHVGTFFVDLPQPIPKDRMANVPNAHTVRDLPCDVLTIKIDNVTFEVCHTRRIKPDRQLLELVELRLPAEVAGFPCLMRRLQQVPAPTTNQTNSTSRQLLQKGVRWAARVAEKALCREIELLEIVEKTPSDSAFTLNESFVEHPTLEDLHRQFDSSSGHHDDWD